MIGLDTNILVRYLTQDDAEQSPLVTAFIRKNCTKTAPCLISVIVLCELAWVLKVTYGIDRKTILGVLEKILQTSQFRVADRDGVRAAIRAALADGLDFPDSLIGQLNHQAGCGFTITLDKKAARGAVFKQLGEERKSRETIQT